MKAEDCKLFSQFFEGDKRQYIIPVYQRNYDWKIENCKKLFDDILIALEKDKTHFVGSIVQVQKDEERGVRPFIIIDGQQRLTTIYLLLKAILDASTRESTKEDLKDSLFNKFRDNPNIRDDRNKLKLKANTQDNKQLMLLMDENINEMNKESTVYANYEYFLNLVNEIIKSGKYEAKDLKRGIEKLTAVVISLKEEHGDDPQAVFERINSTGVELKLDDLIRNFVLMTNIKQEFLFEKYWSYIETHIPKDKRPQFFIDFLNSYTTSKTGTKEAYDTFKEWAKNQSSEEILQKLKKVVKYYAAFIKHSDDYSDQTNNILEGLRRINQSTLYTFLFHIFEDLEDGVINEDIFNDVLSLLLNYSIRRIICEIPSNSLRGLYQTLYRRVFIGIEKKNENYYDAIVSMLVENLKHTRDVFPNDNIFIKGLGKTKIYNRGSRFCKYILGILENNNSKEEINVDSDKITVEHILPKNSNADWRNYLDADYEHIYNTYLDTLGNVTLTGYNEKLSDNSFKMKQEILKKCDTKISYLNKEFIESNNWSEAIIQQRADRLSNAIKNIFAYPSWSGTDYHPVNFAEFTKVTLQTPEDATGKDAKYFEFIGERNEVDSFKDVLTEIAETLYAINENLIQELAQANFSSYLTYNKEKLRSPRKLNNAEIFVETQLSAIAILRLIKKLLEKYGIDESEFALYCKKEG
jgi:uncharacterized protein with ParB-like and HNH nuclease domain